MAACGRAKPISVEVAYSNFPDLRVPSIRKDQSTIFTKALGTIKEKITEELCYNLILLTTLNLTFVRIKLKTVFSASARSCTPTLTSS